MNNGKLKFPSLPTIKFGNKKSAMYIPAEFITLIGGQVRKSAMTGDMTRQLILNAAVRPQERMQFINEENNGNAVSVMRSDPTCAAFGVNNVSPEPIKIPGILLPPARLRYRDSVEEPGLSGQWFTKKFVSTPRADRSNDRNEKGYVYGVLIVANDPYHEMPPSNRPIIDQFTSELERESERECAMKLRPGGPPMVCGYHNDEVRSHLEAMYDGGARIVVVILLSDKFYSMIKFHADLIGLPTQCLLWKNVSRVPKGYHSNILLKMNTKMGGTNHTLASRLPNTERQNVNGEVFQDPPASLSWLFDEHCMMVGIDVAHPDSNSDLESTAAVVATMDGRASQYVAHISSQEKKSEIVKTLEVAFQSLLQAFKARNNAYPKHIIVYRDGVSDGQFGLVLSFELSAIKNAISYEGQLDIKVSIIVCQKKHHSRFVYEESPGVYVNPCPGLVLDASCGTNSISSAEYNEFYLNSHVAIQGTAKCAKYTLIYDEIGFKMPELELLTYWTCYLYARCNKSVSHATPIYYAHWAAKRARHLLNAGGSNRDLLDISKIWAQNDRSSSMFFI
jgi:eukaryotic translation initiation factor 2C